MQFVADGFYRINGRDHMEEKTDRKIGDRHVVARLRARFARSWIRAYFANGNDAPLVIVKTPACGWNDEDLAYCRSAAAFSGGMMLECGSDLKTSVLMAAAERLGPSTWAWIDDDAEVIGNLDECLAYAENAPGFVMARFLRPSSIGNRHPERLDDGRICGSEFMIFHGDASRRLKEDLADGDLPADDRAFGRLYETNRTWREGFCDFSIRKWVGSVGSPGKKIVRRDADASGPGSAKEWEETAARLPKAPFEQAAGGDRVESDGEGPIDAVFVIGTGSVDSNEELRYALRNLERHCRFVRDVYICGFCPKWVDRSAVIHLNWPDRFSHAKDANIIDKLRHACEHKGIAKRILFCSDDQFQTRECEWEDFRPRYLRRYASNDRWYEDRKRVWHTRLRNTLEREVRRRASIGMDVNDVFYYQPHIWMPVDRDRFIDYARWCNYESRTDTIIASGYYNFVDAHGVPDFDHSFIGAVGAGELRTTHAAYHDGSEKAAMKVLKAMFPSRSRFELPEEGRMAPAAKAAKAAEGAIRAKHSEERPGDDPSAATDAELKELHEVMRRVRDNPTWNTLLGEVSRAEELRLFGVRGWRIVWRDIVRRWRTSTHDGADDARVEEGRSEEASGVVSRYMSDPDAMRTVRFGAAANGAASRSAGRRSPRTASDSVVGRIRDKIGALRSRM